ncbi:MAG: hydroxyacid dehydrogenase [Lachnospiraceae bacterium]|nr:hydroxyacid dehydrogenase [Lachnospiraceae bacterium]
MRVPKILITNRISRCGAESLEACGFELVWSKSNAVSDVKAQIGTCDGIIARMTPVREELIKSAPRLKIIGMHGAGLDGIDIGLATQKGIAVTHTPGANAISVAENVMGMILNLAKNTIPADYALRVEGQFGARDRFAGHELAGKTLGIVGLGRIGRKLAGMAGCGFEMKVIACDPYVSAEAMQEIGAGVEKRESIEEVMAQADYVSFHTPMTPEMAGFVNYDRLRLMKPSAYLINEMRGALVNEADLKRALEEGVIAGAALDVFGQEPTPPDFGLFQAPNLIATPHIGASTYESMDRTILTLAEEFRRFFNGEELKYLVNPDYQKQE